MSLGVLFFSNLLSPVGGSLIFLRETHLRCQLTQAWPKLWAFLLHSGNSSVWARDKETRQTMVPGSERDKAMRDEALQTKVKQKSDS